MKRIRYGMMSMAIFFALAMSALNVAPAFADEATPPEVVTEVTEPAAPVEEATPPATEEVVSEPETESASVAEVIEALPEDTTLVVLDEEGEVLPLATEEAAEVVSIADPRWCPVGVTPGGVGCSPSFTYFNGPGGLIQWLTTNQPNKAGVVWIESTYDSSLETGNPVVLDGDDFTSMDNFALTINGGWAGCTPTCVSTLNPNSPSTFNVPFRIIDWTGAVTINNIVIDGSTGAEEGLEVITSGNITLNNVDVQNTTNTNGGAELTNLGNIVVNDSTFNNNAGTTALLIDSNGTVTLKNVTVNGNAEQGASIDTNGAVTLNGTNHFNYNGETGLNIFTSGVITLNNITAMGNTNGSGTTLNNCGSFDGVSCSNSLASSITIKGTNNFSDNGWDGLRVYSSGAITISNITANGNGTDPLRDEAKDPDNNTDLTYDTAYGKGVYLNNFGSATQKAITLSGVNTFNNNASNGITAIASGLLTVSNIVANENQCDPFFEDGTYCAGAYLESYMGITQTGYGRFEDNAEFGLRVLGTFKGAITLNNLYVINNGDYGAYIFGISSTGVNFTMNGVNTFNGNGGYGLYIDTNGTVTLTAITANNNVLGGVSVFNAYTTKAVSVKGVSTFNGNGGDGLFITSYGVITTNGITSTNNNGVGVWLDNCFFSSGACTALTAQAVTMNGNNYIEGNNVLVGTNYGLVIGSRGAITINNLTSIYNDGDGAYIDNQFTNAVGGVTIKGFAYVTNNTDGGSGLEIRSNGAVTLASVTADFNAENGVFIHNEANTLTPMNVTLSGINNFNGNGATGLLIVTYGNILLSNITANDNLNYGADLENNNGSTAKTVTLNGSNIFNGNSNGGLYTISLGAIKVNNLMVNNTTAGDGAYLNNSFAVTNQAITITGYGIFDDNTGVGLTVISNGNITLANISANANASHGASISANGLLNGFANVILTGTNTFNGNTDIGLDITADGNITLNNITANANGGHGALIDNNTLAFGAPKTVTINGVNNFNNNVGTGLSISADGNITLTRITANFNNDPSGATSNGVSAYSSNGNITLTCGSMYNNEADGYSLTLGLLTKIITLKGVFIYGNTTYTDVPAIITRACPLP